MARVPAAERSPDTFARPPREPSASAAYAPNDLLAIAEIARHYLLSGGLELARTLFDGLCAIAPRDADFALCLALACDRLGEKTAALHGYSRAAALAPSDPLPDLNRAELYIEAGRLRDAHALLAGALEKSLARDDAALSRKARALLSNLNAIAPRGTR